MNKSVSVVIPTYNYGQFIKKAVESVLEQTLPISEIIVVDDGSTDDTEKIIKEFGDKIIYIKQQNLGVCAARNNGVKHSSGDFIVFHDADDILYPSKIEKQVDIFSEDPEIGFVHCGMREFNSETGETIQIHTEGEEGWIAEELLLFEKPVIVGPGSIIIKRSVFDEVGGFDTGLKNGEDWEFCYRVARKYKIGFAREVLFDYRNHMSNAHYNVSEMEFSLLKALKKTFDTNDKKVLSLRRRSYGNLHKILAGSYLYNKQYSDFFRNLFWSLWYKPKFLYYYFSLLFSGKKKIM